MKILHTADLHIREYNDARWQALQELIQIGQTREIDVLVISGDLFDSSSDAYRLRPKIRELFSGITWPVLIIAGNHDAEAYPDGAFFGETVTVIRDLLRPVEIEGVFFWGFPYETLMEEEILEYLNLAAGMAQPGAVHLLLFHGELLDITGGWEQYGEEGRHRYLPVKLSYFYPLPWQYVLAGHFHSSFSVHEFREGSYFVYSGSPVAITRRETGPRLANLFEIGSAPAPCPVHSRYYEKMQIRLDPFQTVSPLNIISERLSATPEKATILLEISGYFNGAQFNLSEEELYQALSKLSGHRLEIARMEFHDIRAILEDDLFALFWERLSERNLPDADRQALLDYTLKAMMEL